MNFFYDSIRSQNNDDNDVDVENENVTLSQEDSQISLKSKMTLFNNKEKLFMTFSETCVISVHKTSRNVNVTHVKFVLKLTTNAHVFQKHN